ncbi:hypothetical protein [Azorhizobium sp. AG788]
MAPNLSGVMVTAVFFAGAACLAFEEPAEHKTRTDEDRDGANVHRS